MTAPAQRWRGAKPGSLAAGTLKLAAAVALSWLVLRKIDFHRAFAIALGLSPAVMVVAMVLLVIQAMLAAWRWSLVGGRGGAHLPPGPALRLFMVSLFYNQALPSTVPGDAARVWGAARFGGLQAAAVGVFLDRLLTLIALLVLTLAALALLALQSRGDMLLLAPSLALAAILAAVAVAVRARERLKVLLPGKAGALAGRIGDAIDQLFSSRDIFALGALSLFIHGLGIATFYVLAKGMALPLSPLGALITVPVVLLAALLPLSVNGWGIREATMILVLAGFGIGRTEAATLSVVFGLFQLVLGLSGGIFLLFPTRGADAKAAREKAGHTGP